VVPFVTVRVTVAVCVTPPPVPVTVIVDVPAAAAVPALRVSVEEPAPPEMLTGLKLAVTPEGIPVAERVTALLNPPETALVIVDVPELPATTLTEEGLAERVKLGVVPFVTVSVMKAVFVTPPPVPVTVIVEVPAAALVLAVSVSVDVPAPPEMLAGLKLAVTPLGKPLADRLMVLLNPPETALVIVDVPELPVTTLRDVGFADRVNVGLVTGEPARVAISVAPFGLPQPVTGS
jgi:hypothetical protein